MRVRLPVPAALAAAAALAACSHAQPAPEAVEVKKEAPPSEAAAKVEEKAPEEKAAEFKAEGESQLNQAMEKLKEVSVFFEFDEHTLTKEAAERLSDVGSVLLKHPDLKIKIEGHADERGTPAYNLALGQ